MSYTTQVEPTPTTARTSRPIGPANPGRPVIEVNGLRVTYPGSTTPAVDGVSFHLKLIAAAAGGLADPLTIVDTQRRELLRRLRDAQRAAMGEPEGSAAALLLEGIVLRLQADLRWLEACERNWTSRRRGS